MRAEPLEPEVAAALEAIDGALHGEPVDPEFAELAELSLILRDERPLPNPGFERDLDFRVRAGFPQARPRSAEGARRGRGWWAGSAAGVVATVAAVIVAVVLVHGGGPTSSSSSASSSIASALPTPAAASGSSAASASAGGSAVASGGSSAAANAGAPSVARNAKSPALGPAPVPSGASGHQIAQSAQLSLVARPGKVDAVAQQVFAIVGQERGHVADSEVSAQRRGESTAQITLQVPSGRLQQTLTQLSQLRGASVSSRSDASQDVTSQIGGARDRLVQARALRRSLLRQLAAATTPGQVQSDQRQLRRNLAAIARDRTAITHLHARVADSTISVSVRGPAARTRHPSHTSGGGAFTLHRGLHDAGRVLVVAAGVALIVLAVLVPVGLLAALGVWGWMLLRRRRREGALGPRA
jgi:hypothetical protein